jgi:hypothetical protein
MGKTNKALVAIVAAIVLLACFRIAITIVNKPDDPKLIQEALNDAIQASREGRPGGVVELFSDNLKLNNVNVGGNERQITDFIQKQKPSLEFADTQAQITGSEARIVSPVSMDLGILGKRELKDVTLIFKKEDTTEYLIIPTTKWRLVEVRAPDSAVSDLLAG